MGYSDGFEPMKKKNRSKSKNDEFYDGKSKKGKKRRQNKRDDDKNYGF